MSDLNQSKKFWAWLLCEKLGYEKSQEWPEGVSYKQDKTYLVFVQTELNHTSPSYHRKRTGLNHLAFHGISKDFIDQLAKELTEKNIPLLYDSPTKGDDNYSIFFEDPDRIKVELTIDTKAT